MAAVADSPAADAVAVAAVVVPGSVASLAGSPAPGSNTTAVKAVFLINSTRRAKEELYGHEIANDI